MTQLPLWTAIAPAAILAVTALLLLVVDAVDPDTDSSNLLAGLAVLGTLASIGVTGWYLLSGTGQPPTDPITLFRGALVVDGMSLFFTALVGSVVVLIVLASYDYLADHPYQAEYYTLVMLAATGMSLMASANSLATAFISLELASLPSYALVASLKHNRGSVEAGLKYFLIGALSSAVFAYGISLVYAASGSLRFADVATAAAGTPLVGILGLGIVFVAGGFAFKTASVPFHFWAPEAYEGAPSPVSAFLSSASKAAGFVLLFRVFVEAFPQTAVAGAIDWAVAFQVLAVVTMTVGNFAAATQDKVKRMLAYSSIGHAGYVLIAVAALTGDANQSFVLGSGMAHLLVYGFMNTGAFLFIALTEYWDVGRTFEDFNGLAKQAPFACAAMTIFLFSLAGLPFGGGFLSKFYLLMASVNGGVAILAVALVVNSALSLYYYTRVVRAMWIEEPNGDLEVEGYPTGLYAAIAVAAVMTVLLLPAFGPVAEIANTAASALV
ncbi:NADH-quinone oxidoreductase subunit N [Salinirussus salinus]|jgi:NADH-quinone oxidoreductase subunit N|uniref:NADH-quinone oxidoreductase subunit N n=1 Tax=Salinirussus salinus TaxID=1198300 RepID=UPI00135706A5|nr:NADH-quinone oxidoreductase subunit N [Salinirussus salinus]